MPRAVQTRSSSARSSFEPIAKTPRPAARAASTDASATRSHAAPSPASQAAASVERGFEAAVAEARDAAVEASGGAPQAAAQAIQAIATAGARHRFTIVQQGNVTRERAPLL